MVIFIVIRPVTKNSHFVIFIVQETKDIDLDICLSEC